jgi:hypothetical protein
MGARRPSGRERPRALRKWAGQIERAVALTASTAATMIVVWSNRCSGSSGCIRRALNIEVTKIYILISTGTVPVHFLYKQERCQQSDSDSTKERFTFTGIFYFTNCNCQ